MREEINTPNALKNKKSMGRYWEKDNLGMKGDN